MNRAVGCSKCFKTGYLGRAGIYELLVVDEPMRRLIHERAPEHTVRAAALAAGMTPPPARRCALDRHGTPTARRAAVRVSREG